MNVIRTVFLKDLRRFRGLLALWVLALIVRASVAAFVPVQDISSGRGEGMFAALLVVLVNALLVMRALAEDSPVKEGAFWRTRPIAGGDMLVAKVAFVVGWTLIFPAVVTAIAGICYGFAPDELLVVLTGQSVMHGVVALVFGLLSIFTTRVWLTLIGLWLSGTVLGLVLKRPLFGPVASYDVSEAGAWAPASLELTRSLLAYGAFLVAAAVAAWFVYRDRRRAVAALVLMCGFVTARTLFVSWPLNLLAWVSASERFDARPLPGVEAKLKEANFSPSLMTINGVTSRRVEALVSFEGLQAGEVALPYRVEGVLAGPNNLNRTQALHVSRFSFGDITPALAELGVGKSPAGGARMGAPGVVVLASLPQHEWGVLQSGPVEWRGRIWARVGQMRPMWRVAARPGATFSQGPGLVAVLARANERDMLRLNVAERRVDYPRWNFDGALGGPTPLSMHASFALVRDDLGESIVASGGGGSGGTNDGLFENFSAQLHFRLPPAHIRRDWVEHADLVQIGFVETRRVIVEAKVVLSPVAGE